MTDTRPRYRIQAVAKMTDVPAPTLRAWERRYGIPRPQRTESSYRLYSDHDIDQIRRLRAYCEQGMAPSEAAALVARQSVPVITAGEDQVKALHTHLVAAIEAYDEVEIERLLARALLIGPASQVYDALIAPTMEAVGQRWKAGTLGVAHEHLASTHLGNAVRSLLRLSQPTAPTYTVLLACCTHEHHVLPLYGAALRFAGWGIRAVVLGADTPASALKEARLALKPDLVGISLTAPRKPKAADALMTEIAKACGATPWIVGGAGAEAHRALVESLGGHIAVHDPAALRTLIDPLLRSSAA